MVVDQAPAPEPQVDESLTELNVQLTKELKQLQSQIDQSSIEVKELEAANSTLQLDLQQLKEKNASQQREQHAEFGEQLAELAGAKEKEISFLQLEMKKLLEENEQVIKHKIIKKIMNTLLK